MCCPGSMQLVWLVQWLWPVFACGILNAQCVAHRDSVYALCAHPVYVGKANACRFCGPGVASRLAAQLMITAQNDALCSPHYTQRIRL